MDDLEESHSAKKFRYLTMALMLSGALNIALITAQIVSGSSKDGRISFIRQVTTGSAPANTALDRVALQMSQLSFHELLSCLTNRDALSDGYLKRDLAIALLVSRHHFHIEKALSGSVLQKRMISLVGGEELQMFAGLNEEQYDAIIRFAYEEKWPLTTEGLFKVLKGRFGQKDESLMQALVATQEFRALQTLFHKTGSYPSTFVLLQLISEGSFELLNQFTKEQERLLDLSGARRRTLLLSYLTMQSTTAAQLLLETDFSFIAKQLEDRGIIEVLSLLFQKTEESERLCIELLKSPRSDAVWAAAATLLYTYAGERMPEPFDVHQARVQFVGKSQSSPLPPAITPPKGREHVVKEGESLWRIARLYEAKVDDIIRLNEIEKNRIFPGMVLKIPH